MRQLAPIVVAACLAFAAAISPARAQGAAADDAEPERRQARAVRVANGAIRLDGRLSEEAWQRAPALTGFVQKEPDEGAPPSDPIAVHIAYDDDALDVIRAPT